MAKKYLQLNDIDCYKAAFKLSNYVWSVVNKWDHFAKDTVGRQFVRSIDSISANIAEGFGRYPKKDKINFFRYSSGSVKESLDWNEKSRARQLIDQSEYQAIFDELSNLPKLINQLIKYTNDKLEK